MKKKGASPSERSLRLWCRTLEWLHWSLCSRLDLTHGTAPDPLCPAHTHTHTRTTRSVLSGVRRVGGVNTEPEPEPELTHMARLTLFPVMLSFFVRKDACREEETTQRSIINNRHQVQILQSIRTEQLVMWTWGSESNQTQFTSDRTQFAGLLAC